jgi:hypothetical protein
LQTGAICTDGWIPGVKVLKVDTVIIGNSPATISGLHKIEIIAVGNHTGLWHIVSKYDLYRNSRQGMEKEPTCTGEGVVMPVDVDVAEVAVVVTSGTSSSTALPRFSLIDTQ